MLELIVNPKGGNGKSLAILSQITALFDSRGAKYHVNFTEYAGHAKVIAATLTSTDTAVDIVVLGGDGTLHEVLAGIDKFDNLRLGVIPCGTGNDFVRASKHPTDPLAAAEIVLADNASYVDFIQVGDERSLNVAGAGMDVDVLLRFAQLKDRFGRAAYYVALLDTLIHSRGHALKITADDGEALTYDAFMVGIGNGRCIGGGMPVCPHSEIDDGLLDVVIINNVPRRRILFLLAKFLKGKHTQENYTKEFRCKRLSVEILDDSRFEFDGEVQPAGIRTLDFERVHEKLKMFR